MTTVPCFQLFIIRFTLKEKSLGLLRCLICVLFLICLYLQLNNVKLTRLLGFRMKLSGLWFGCVPLKINFIVLLGNVSSINSMHMYYLLDMLYCIFSKTQMFYPGVESVGQVFLIPTQVEIMILHNHQNRLKNKYV